MTEPAALGDRSYVDLSGKSLSSQSINPGIRNCILVLAGQSNICNLGPTAYTPTNIGKVDNLNPCNGAIYTAVDPLLGCSSTGGNPGSRLADKLINASLFDRVVLVPVAIGGSAAADWQNSYGNRLTAALGRVRARLGVSPSAILWGQGEADTNLATSQSSYQASMTAVISATRTAGYTGPWFIAQQSWNGGATSAAVQAAQLALVDHGSNIWAGPNADSLGAADRQADNTHFNDAGMDAYAGLWLTALQAFGAPF
jgi:hypothetical protein